MATKKGKDNSPDGPVGKNEIDLHSAIIEREMAKAVERSAMRRAAHEMTTGIDPIPHNNPVSYNNISGGGGLNNPINPPGNPPYAQPGIGGIGQDIGGIGQGNIYRDPQYIFDTKTNFPHCACVFTSVKATTDNDTMFSAMCDLCGRIVTFKPNMGASRGRLLIGLILDLLIGGTDKERDEALEKMADLAAVVQREREGLDLIESLYDMIQAKVAETMT